MNNCTVEKKIKNLIDLNVIPPYVYTYPPRSTYRELSHKYSTKDIWELNEQVYSGEELNLYIHFPFCAYKCGYCNMYTITSTDKNVYSLYSTAICSQLLIHRDLISRKKIKTVFLGGGTPTLLSIQDFIKIFKCLDEINLNWRETTKEFCIEASPDSIVKNPELVSELIAHGIDRINLGVQSLNNFELHNMGRGKANHHVVEKAIEQIKKLQLPNFSTDLIIGFSEQSDKSFVDSLKVLIDYNPETISTYFLTLRSDSFFSTKEDYKNRNNASLYSKYDIGTNYLLEKGYSYSSHNRFKKSNKGGYLQQELQFQGIPVLGIGLGSRSYNYFADYLIMNDGKIKKEQLKRFLEIKENELVYPYSYFIHSEEELIRRKFALGIFNMDITEFINFESYKYSWIYKDIIEACDKLNLIDIDCNSKIISLTRKGAKYRDIISWSFFSEEVKKLDQHYHSLT